MAGGDRTEVPNPRRRALLAVLGAGALAGCAPAARPGTVDFRGFAMGAFYSVRIAERRLSPLARAAARDAVADAIAAVDDAMSTFKPESELSRFNRHASNRPFALSAATCEVLTAASHASAATLGAFDVTVAPAVEAWGFGAVRGARIADDARVAALAPRLGWRQLELDAATHTARKARPDVAADLSGIAKGYAVDRAAAALDALGFGHYVIEAGGEVRARGRNAAGVPWQVGIEQPDASPRRLRYVLPLADASIATSGDYRVYFERDGRRYCHEIDPTTGRPMDSGLASVSVVGPRCMQADALAKLIVLGPDRAFAQALALGLPAYFVVREADGRLTDRATPAFAALGGRGVSVRAA